MVVLTSHDDEERCYFRRYQYEYVVIYRKDSKVYLQGKRRYGCVDTIELTETERERYLDGSNPSSSRVVK